MAATDTLLTVGFAGALAAVAKGGFPVWLLLVWASSEALHHRFGITTSTRKWLFGEGGGADQA